MSRKTKKFLKNIEAKALPYTVLFLLIAVVFSGLFLVLPPGDKSVRAAPGDFAHSKLITIESDYVDDTLSNFPVLVYRASDSDLTGCQADGDDIVFYSYDNNTQYNHEIEYFNSATGELYAWVNVTSVSSSSDTSFWMYYEDGDASNQEDVAGTWSNGYVAVWHMGGTTDSLSSYNLTEVGNPSVVSGDIGNATDFDGDDGYYHDTLFDDFPTSFSVEGLVRFDADDTIRDYIIHKSCIDGDDQFHLRQDDSDELDLYLEGQNAGVQHAYSTSAMSNNIWYFTGCSWTAGAVGYVYLDDDEQNTGTNVPEILDGTDTNFSVGFNPSQSLFLNGKIDELRVSNVVRNTSWMETMFHSMNMTTGFLIVGSEQTGGAGVGEYEISGLNVDTRFIWSGEADTSVWANATGVTYETLAIHTNVSEVSDNCTDIFIDFGSLGIDSDITEEHINITVARNVTDFTSNLYKVPSGGNVTINASVWDAQSWCAGDNPFPIVGVNITIYVRARITIPAGKSPGTYTNASGWLVKWKVIS